MPNYSSATMRDDATRVFRALADPTRRRVVELLQTGPMATKHVAAEFAMALPSLLEHLKRLEECGLITSTKHGRVRTYSLEPQRLDVAGDWLEAQRRTWRQRLDQLDEHLHVMKQEQQ